MQWPYGLSRSATRELQDIADYWSERVGSDYAVKVLTKIIDKILLYSQQQRAGRPAESYGRGVRCFPAGRYMIYYRIVRGNLHVLRVIHGSRDQKSAWTG
jgi:toxin ParE1/3/4